MFTGTVDDVRPYIDRAGVYVVPLRVGGGTRIKIFEAMAMAKAIVSTTVGAEGLPVEPGEHIVIADDPRTFATEVVRLLTSHDERRELAGRAQHFVRSGCSWEAAASSLHRNLRGGPCRRTTPIRRRPLSICPPVRFKLVSGDPS